MHTCLVTGAAGFVGSHLTERLLADGCDVIGVDSLTDYYDVRQKRLNLARALRHPRFTFVVADLLSADLGALLRDVDVIFHLAAQPGVRGSWGSSFGPYVRNNVEATQRLLDATRSAAIDAFVYASSSSVYGLVEPMREDNVTHPFSPYGVTKLAAEHLCMLYAANYGIPATAVRYFTVFGPRQRPDMAFTRFIDAVLDGRPIHIMGDGSRTRDFTFVDDAVAGTIAAARRGRRETVYNVGGGCHASLAEAIALIEEATGIAATLIFDGSEKGDVPDTRADSRRAYTELGFVPAVDLATGIARQVAWVRQNKAELAAWSPIPATTPALRLGALASL